MQQLNTILGFLFFSLATQGIALASPTANVNKDGIALCDKSNTCYDPVSYFKGDPKKGQASLKASNNGVDYLFADEASKAEFAAHPEKYAPAFEGWCATAVAKGKKYAIDPLNFKITNGRLFLFYRESGLFGGDAKPEWVKNETESIKRADANWPKVREEKP